MKIIFGELTALGQELQHLPLHPRQSRLLHDARVAGAPDLGAALAALGQERDPRPRDYAVGFGGDDIQDRLQALSGKEPVIGQAVRDCRQLMKDLNGDLEAAHMQAMLKPELIPQLLLSSGLIAWVNVQPLGPTA